MNSKKWTLTLLTATFLTLIFFASVTYVLDPLLRYGSESSPLSFYAYTETYANPGIAKNYSYDSVMVGTSMIENTDADLCNQLWNVNMVRLPYAGGTTYNMKTILDVAFRSNPSVKNVYWELDEFQLFGSATEPRYPLPDYLYNDTHTQDLKYLLNLDIFYQYTLTDILYTLRGRTENLERRNTTLTGNFGKEYVLAGYQRPEPSAITYHFHDSEMQKIVDANLNNIETLLIQNPDTQFHFFMVPFSVLYWDREIQLGAFDARLDAVLYFMEKLLPYENVNIYFYQGEQEIISDLDNYKDYSHYGEWINNLLTEYMAEEKNKITIDNYQQYVNQLREYIYSFDFDSILSR